MVKQPLEAIPVKPLTRLTVERERRGWSRSELARRAGMHPADVGRLEAGKAYLWPAWRRRLSQAFGLPEEVLLEGVPADDERERD